jgi:hypothetical protein
VTDRIYNPAGRRFGKTYLSLAALCDHFGFTADVDEDGLVTITKKEVDSQ